MRAIQSSTTISLFHFYKVLFLFLGAGIVTACTPNNTQLISGLGSGSTVTTSSSPTPTPAAGVRAVRINLQQADGGSFDSLSAQNHAAGTIPIPGSGHIARKLYNPDGTFLANVTPAGVKSANWPLWLSSFEIGVSGSLNTSAPNPNCATFAGVTESTLMNCLLGPSSTPSQCGAPSGQFRVSEVDCSIASASGAAASTGTGGPSDGIYMRAQFDRSNLGTNENILVIIEYAASALNPAPANPATCLSGGKFTPENCSDFVWRAYLKHSASELVLPYLLLIPPTPSAVLSPGVASGAGIAAKQFILPLAADANLTTLQISRTQSNFPSNAALLTACSNGGRGNSPLCAGVIFYSITFYRM